MNISDIKLTISAEDISRMVVEMKSAKSELAHHADEYQRRLKLLELNERKLEAYKEFHSTQGLCLNRIMEILKKRITKSDHAKIDEELAYIDAAWKKFNAVQLEVEETRNKML